MEAQAPAGKAKARQERDHIVTFEKKCIVEPSDIMAVHFECAHCHAATVVPITGGVTEQAGKIIASSCQFCGTAWGFLPHSNEHKVLHDFASAVEQIAAHLEGRNLKLGLEIRCPETLTSSHASNVKD